MTKAQERRLAERRRIHDILTCSEAVSRPVLARHLAFHTGMSVTLARNALHAAPEEISHASTQSSETTAATVIDTAAIYRTRREAMQPAGAADEEPSSEPEATINAAAIYARRRRAMRDDD